ncbi:hypothetical protein GCM10010266_68500 [Streptomyces griseomycini]|nr:hypothetical protein GCM10010266_68500 [Streptomyces griseomycini]GGR63523.1 hypothetical protein GCM10015536_78370 [Streptomyces griseomycini]
MQIMCSTSAARLEARIAVRKAVRGAWSTEHTVRCPPHRSRPRRHADSAAAGQEPAPAAERLSVRSRASRKQITAARLKISCLSVGKERVDHRQRGVGVPSGSKPYGHSPLSTLWTM